MKSYDNCKMAVQDCIAGRKFTVAYLYNEEKTMEMHIHNCYEIYYSISGGKHFLIGDKCYDVEPGDAFVINQYETHYVTPKDTEAHERIVVSIYPDFLASLSTPETDLAACFHDRAGAARNRIRLDKESRQRLVFYTRKITSASGFGADLIESTTFVELMVMLNRRFLEERRPAAALQYQYNSLVMELMEYINANIREKLTVRFLAEHFFVSESYLCRAFRLETGTTINKYITARRISIAKALLMNGASVAEACEGSGFNDYVNFVKSFTSKVGMPPKRFSKYSSN